MSRFRTTQSLVAKVLGLLLAAHASAQPSVDHGRPIVELIEALRQDGTTVIYSSDLLDESLVVLTEPTATGGLDRLREALAEHGLALRAGPQDAWLVVAADAAPADRPGTLPEGSRLQPALPDLETIVVSASRYAFSRSVAPLGGRIDRRQLDNAPTLGEDALRATHSLPGLTSSGLTARVNVRGGETNEALLYLDGVRLRNPFHLQDFQSLFGSISPRIIDFIDVHTGGFSAEFGDRMSAVVDMHTLTPDVRRHHEISVSTLSSALLSSGQFADGRGTWLTSLRRGNLDILIDAAGSDAGKPQYTDFFNKLTYAFHDGLQLTAGILSLDDKITLSDGDFANASSDGADAYIWLSLDQTLTDRLAATYRLTRTRLTGDRAGSLDQPDVSTGRLDERRRFDAVSLAARWDFAIAARQRLSWGIDIESADADYELALARDLPHPIVAPGFEQPPLTGQRALELDDERRGLYVSHRWQALDNLTTELGVRIDRQSHLQERQTSPRMSVMLDLDDRTTLRMSWGRFHQAQGIDELQAADGQTEPTPAQESEHSVLSFERLIGDTLTLRIEAYRKEFEKLRPRFENLFMRVSLLPELLPDRVMLDPPRGEAYGTELSLAAAQGAWQWSFSLSHASVEDSWDERRVRRSWEEPWSIKADLFWTGPRWRASLATQVHTGWPITPLELVEGELRAGAFNSARLERFRSVDVRASRLYALESGELELFMQVSNLLNFDNPCCYDYALETDSAGTPVSLSVDEHEWLPTIPTIGFAWRFGRQASDTPDRP